MNINIGNNFIELMQGQVGSTDSLESKSELSLLSLNVNNKSKC